MAVSSTTKRKQVTLSTGTDAISTGIYVTDSDQLKVIRTRSSTDTTLTEDTHYTVSFASGGGAATVTMIGQAALDIITVIRDMDFTQQSEYPDGARISETELEADLDLSVMRDQQLLDINQRTIRFKETATDAQIAGAEIDADATAGYVLTAGAGGTGIPGWAAPATSSSVTGSTYSSLALLKAATGVSVGTISAVSDGTDRSGFFQLRNGAPSEAAGDYQGIELTSAVGASYHWRRLYDGAPSLLWFGVSESASDNATAIQAAIDFANSGDPPDNHSVASSYEFFLPAGDYKLRTPIYIKKGFGILGESQLGTRLNLSWESIAPTSLTQTSGTATAVFASSHGLTSGDWIRVNGGTSQTITNGNFSGNVITWTAHGLTTGDALRFYRKSLIIDGLIDEQVVYAIKLTDDTLSLATSAANASAGTVITLGDPDGLSGKLETVWNWWYQVTVTSPTQFTFTVDANAKATFPGTAAVVKHGLGLVTNWVYDPTDEDDPGPVTSQNNASIRNLTFLPDYDYEPPANVWMMRWKYFTEPRIEDCRFLLHQAGGGNPFGVVSDRLNGVWLDQSSDVMFRNNTLDLGGTQVRSGRIGTAGSNSRCHITNNYFYAFRDHGLRLDYSYGWIIANNRSVGATTLDATRHLQFDANATGNTVMNWSARELINCVIEDNGARNHLYGIEAQAANSGVDNSSLRGVCFNGNNSLLSGFYGYNLKIGVEFGPDSYANRVGEGFKAHETEQLFSGTTRKNEIMQPYGSYDRPAWQFSGVDGYIEATLGAALATSTFSFYIRFGLLNLDSSGQGLLYVGDNSGQPAAQDNMFRVFVDGDGKLFIALYDTGTTNYRYLVSRNGLVVPGVEYDFYFARNADGTWTTRSFGQDIVMEESTQGTPPADWAASIAGTQFAIGHTGSAWGGWISEVILFNEDITRERYLQALQGRLQHVPAVLGRAQSLSSINGGFETNTTGWNAVGTATLTRTSDGASAGTYSMRIGAAADGDGTWTNCGASSTSGMRRYRVTFDAKYESGVTDWRVSRNDGTGYVDITVDNAAGFDSYSVVIGGELDNTTAILKIAAVGGAGSILIDNVTVTEVGAMLAWSAERKPYNAPTDVSGNSLNGTIGGTVNHSHWTPLTTIADAETSHALNSTFSDTEVEAALNALGTKINTIIDRLQATGDIA